MRSAARDASWPAMVTVPLEGTVRVERIFSKVVFPAPFGPTRPRHLPGSSCRFTLCRAKEAPKRLVTRSRWTINGRPCGGSWRRLDTLVLMLPNLMELAQKAAELRLVIAATGMIRRVGNRAGFPLPVEL